MVFVKIWLQISVLRVEKYLDLLLDCLNLQAVILYNSSIIPVLEDPTCLVSTLEKKNPHQITKIISPNSTLEIKDH